MKSSILLFCCASLLAVSGCNKPAETQGKGSKATDGVTSGTPAPVALTEGECVKLFGSFESDVPIVNGEPCASKKKCTVKVGPSQIPVDFCLEVAQ